MASGGRTFSPEEIHDILDQSDDFDDEPMMDGSDDEFEDISSEIEQELSSDNSVITCTQSPSPISNPNPQILPVITHTPSPQPLSAPISTPNTQQSATPQLQSTPSRGRNDILALYINQYS